MRALSTMTVLVALLLSSGAAHAQDVFGQPSAAPSTESWTRMPAEVPPPAAPTAEAPERKHRPGNPLALRFDGAFAYRRLFALEVTGADTGFGLGVQTDHHVAWWWATRLSRGDTNNGLDVWSFRTGAEVEGVYDPVRFGLGLSLLMVDVGRAERSQSLRAWGAEGRLFVRVDAYRSDAVALFLRASLEGGAESSSGSAFWGPNLGLGIEFGVAGERRPEWR